MRYLRHASLQQARNLTTRPVRLCVLNAATSPHEAPTAHSFSSRHAILTSRPVRLCIPNVATPPHEAPATLRLSSGYSTLKLVLCTYTSRTLQQRRMRLCDTPFLSGHANLQLVLCVYASRMLQDRRMRHLRHATAPTRTQTCDSSSALMHPECYNIAARGTCDTPSLKQARSPTTRPVRLCVPNAATSLHEVPTARRLSSELVDLQVGR